MSKDTFVCAICGGTFDKTWSDEEAQAEYEKDMGVSFRPEEAGLVCDGCYQKFGPHAFPLLAEEAAAQILRERLGR